MSDLLTDEKIKQLCVKYLAWDEPVSNRDLELIKPLFKAQDAKTAKGKDREWVKWVLQLIDKIKDAMWKDDWGIKGVIYPDMLDELVKTEIEALKKEVEDG